MSCVAAPSQAASAVAASSIAVAVVERVQRAARGGHAVLCGRDGVRGGLAEMWVGRPRTACGEGGDRLGSLGGAVDVGVGLCADWRGGVRIGGGGRSAERGAGLLERGRGVLEEAGGELRDGGSVPFAGGDELSEVARGVSPR